ncbi:cytochrome P450 [Galactobacter valiniphilus]|uniref:cytochrome P450 n=1 Tax=Galactobacter valiniphilus TaxID=2676122 RepID=UPI003736C177
MSTTAGCPFHAAQSAGSAPVTHVAAQPSPGSAPSTTSQAGHAASAEGAPAASLATAVELPVADWIDPAELVADPYASYARLRAESPVAWVPELGKALVTSFAGCHEVEQDQEIFSANVAGSTQTRALGAQPMLRKDDPDHATERAPLNPVLRPKNIKDAWAPVFEANAQGYLDALEAVPAAELDLNRHYAAPLAAKNLADLLGLKDVDVETVRRWSHDYIAGMGNVLDDPDVWLRCETSISEADALLDQLIPYYLAHPDTSMISALAHSGLDEAAVRANIKLTISGGMNEPQHMITSIVSALHDHPEFRPVTEAGAPDREATSAWAAIFDEAVRWRSPIGMYPRQTTRDTVLEGVLVPAGTQLGVVVGSANHDAAQFGDTAAEFNPGRPKAPHLGFGAGVHLCAGHWAAKTSIGQIAVPALYERFPGLAVDASRPTTWDGWVFRGITSLPVTLG